MNGLMKHRSLLPDSMVDEFSRFSKFFGDFQGWLADDPFFKDFFALDRSRISAKPKVDIKETDTEYIVVADVVGFEKEDISIEARDNYLSISGEVREEKRKEHDPLWDSDGEWIYRELSFRKFNRVLPFRVGIDKEGVSAEVKSGLLTIKVPKLIKKAKDSVSVEVR